MRRYTGGGRPGMQDVADAAGVALGTVSNVLNHPDRVAPKTLERVRVVIAEMGYVPNGNARSLAAGSSASVGLVIPDLDNSFFIDLASGAQAAARQRGAILLLGSSGNDLAEQSRYLDVFDESRVGGILLAPMRDSREVIARVRQHGRPVVLLNYRSRTQDACSVLMDNERDGELAVEHLVSRGAERLTFVGGPARYQPISDRRIGARRAARRAGIDMSETHPPGITVRDGRVVATEHAKSWLEGPRVGIVAATDALAGGILQVLASADAVPRQVSVVGCDGNRMAGEPPISLTSVVPPARRMGEIALNLLLDERDADQNHQHQTILLSPELVVRDST